MLPLHAEATLFERAQAFAVRWPAIRPFAVVGGLCTIAGGVAAAVTEPLHLARGSWLAAFLVLVGGVGQVGLGTGQALLSRAAPRRRLVRTELMAWNGGAAGVVAGTLASSPVLTSLASGAVAVALLLVLRQARPAWPTTTRGGRWYLGLAAVLLVSTPVGVVLSWLRHG